MKIGYARTGTGEDTLAQQRKALRAAGCERIYEDADVGAAAVFKPALVEALRAAKPGDVLVIWRLDRLARPMGTLLTDVQLLEHLQLEFETIEEGIATWKPGGFYALARALARFNDQVARSRRGGEAADRPGRRPALGQAQWRELVDLMRPPTSMSVTQAAAIAGISRQAIHKRLKAEGIRIGGNDDQR